MHLLCKFTNGTAQSVFLSGSIGNSFIEEVKNIIVISFQDITNKVIRESQHQMEWVLPGGKKFNKKVDLIGIINWGVTHFFSIFFCCSWSKTYSVK